MKVNQVAITIYDNKPNMAANYWYDTATDPQVHKNRFVLQMDFLSSRTKRLRASIGWPANQFRRLEYWQHNRDFYEDIVDQARQLQADIRAGRINARIPALIGIPNQNKSIRTAQGQTRFKWHMPLKPSAVIAVREYVTTTEYRWIIQWKGEDHYRSFIIDSTGNFIRCQNKTSTSVSQQYPGVIDIQDELVMCSAYDKIQIYSEEEVDIDYQRWREYIQGLYRQDLTPMNRMIIESEFKQNPEYFQRLNKEINE